MEALTRMDRIERGLRKLQELGLQPHGFSLIYWNDNSCLQFGMSLGDVYCKPREKTNVLEYPHRSHVYGVGQIRHRLLPSHLQWYRNHPNIFCILKGKGKAVLLAVFVLLDSTLQDQNKIWVTLFCVSLVLHLIHFIVVFGVTEEYDIAGGFTQASFVLLYGIITSKWLVVPMIIGAIIITCYKTLLLEGVAPKIEELPVVESEQTGEVEKVNEGGRYQESLLADASN